MSEQLRRRESHDDSMYTQQRLRHLHEVTTFMHSERGS